MRKLVPKMVMAALLVGAPAHAAESSPFGGIPGLKFEYYEVSGRTPAEIYASMRARAPASVTDVGGIGKTAWHMKVGWRESSRGKSCVVDDPIASLSITIHLPRLADPSQATPEGQAFWRAAIAGLEIHEAGHARIAWDNRHAFARAARGATCKSIKKIAEKVQAEIDAIQQAYDRDTRHGVTQMPPIGF